MAINPEFESCFDLSCGVCTVGVDNPLQLAAEARARKLAEQASVNEVILTIERLEDEVREMTIASRFKADKIPSESKYAGVTDDMNPSLRGLNEQDCKRQTLLLVLAGLKNRVINIVAQLEFVVMDIEATKTEG